MPKKVLPRSNLTHKLLKSTTRTIIWPWHTKKSRNYIHLFCSQSLLLTKYQEISCCPKRYLADVIGSITSFVTNPLQIPLRSRLKYPWRKTLLLDPEFKFQPHSCWYPFIKVLYITWSCTSVCLIIHVDDFNVR